ncbi:MAG TPA: DUF4836 family protein, partial [Segetibacter sp.]
SIFIVFAAAFITSCKKPVPAATKHIPKNAVFVATINTGSMQSKLAKSQTSIQNILRSLSGNDTSATKGKQEWEDLKTAGIELDENIYFAIAPKAASAGAIKSDLIISLIGSLESASKFEEYVKKKFTGSEIRKEKEYSYTTVEGNKIIAWGSEVVIAITNEQAGNPAMEYDSSTGAYNFKQPLNTAEDLKGEMANYFNIKEETSVAAIPQFRDLMQDKSDASFWVNSGATMDGFSLPLPKLKELFSNNFTAATINFNEGKIAVESKSYYSNELRDLLKQYEAPNANLDLIESFPSDNINAFAAFSFNPDFFNGLVKYMEVGGIVDGYLTKMMGTNYTLPELLKAIKGEFAVVVADITMPATDTTMGMNTQPGTIPAAQVIVNIPVGDKNQMNRLMNKLVEMQMMVKVQNEYRLVPSMQQTGWQAVVNDKNLILASSETLLTTYTARTKKAKLAADVVDDFKGKPGIVYANIESILNSMPANQNPATNSVLLKAKETFKDVKGYTKEFNGQYLEGHMELRFKNEKENSLTSLLSFFETASKNARMNERKTDDEETITIDSSARAKPVKLDSY